MDDRHVSRRELLKLGLGAGSLVAAVGLAWPDEAHARGRKDLVATLRNAIEKENRAAWAYRTAIGTGKLSDGIARIATSFAAQHAEHAEALRTAIRKLGGSAPASRKTYNLSAFAPDLANEKGLVILSIKLEADAVKTYHQAVSRLKEPALRAVAASILGDEAMHLAVLRDALGLDPVPAAFVTDPAAWPMP